MFDGLYSCTMVDPISIVSLIAITLQTSGKVRDLLSETKDAPEDIQETVGDCTSIRDVLKLLKDCLDDGDDSVSHVGAGLRLPLENTSAILERLIILFEPYINTKAQKWQLIKWVLKQKEIDDIRRKMKDYQATLAMALTVFLKIDTRAINTHTNSIVDKQTAMMEIIKSLDNKLIAKDISPNEEQVWQNPTDTIGLSKYLESLAIARYSPPPTNGAGLSTFDEDLDDATPPPEIEGIKSPSKLSEEHEAEIDRLLCQSSSLSIVNDNGQTALHLAAQQNSYLTQKAISNGANVDERNIENEIPLMSAVIAENTETVKLLLKNGGNINTISDRGRTPLHFAAMHNKDMAIPQLLIRRGADSTAVDDEGRIPLFIAAHRGNYSFCIHLLENGASV